MSRAEASGFLVGSPAFKAGEAGDPCLAGSIPVRLRHNLAGYSGAGIGWAISLVTDRRYGT